MIPIDADILLYAYDVKGKPPYRPAKMAAASVFDR
jgi:hypothetical protein